MEQTNLRTKVLRCIYCQGDVLLDKDKSLYFVYLKCMQCRRKMMIFKEDYLCMGISEGDKTQKTFNDFYGKI